MLSLYYVTIKSMNLDKKNVSVLSLVSCSFHVFFIFKTVKKPENTMIVFEMFEAEKKFHFTNEVK